jgi:hypothetical protein
MIDPLIQQYIIPVLMWIAGLFTSAEWRSFLLIVGITIAATHTIKIAWRHSPLRGGSPGHLYLISAVIGFMASGILWPTMNWWIPGIIAGPASALIFKIAFSLLKRFVPGFAAKLNMERRKQVLGPPPGGVRRKEDGNESP